MKRAPPKFPCLVHGKILFEDLLTFLIIDDVGGKEYHCEQHNNIKATVIYNSRSYSATNILHLKKRLRLNDWYPLY